MHDVAAVDSYIDIAQHNTGQGVVLLICLFVFGSSIHDNVIGIRTATTAIDIATVGIVISAVSYILISVVRFFGIMHNNISSRSNTDGAAMNLYISIMERVAILTTAVNRTIDSRTISARSTYRHLRILNPCQFVMDFTRSTNVTTRRTEDHTVLSSIDTNSAAKDSYLGKTGIRFPCSRHVRNRCLSYHIINATTGDSSHRTIRTATIYIMVYSRCGGRGRFALSD